MDSDYIANDFSPFPDKSVEEAEQEEIRRQVRDSIDLLNELVSHYDEAIDRIKSGRTSDISLTLFPKRFAIHERAERRVLTFIENEKEFVTSLIKEHSK